MATTKENSTYFLLSLALITLLASGVKFSFNRRWQHREQSFKEGSVQNLTERDKPVSAASFYFGDGNLTYLMKPVTCTFVIVCGRGDVNTVDEMRSLLTSAILLTTCPLHFIFISDAESARGVTELFQKLNNTVKPVSVDIWTISTKFITRWATHFKFDLKGHLESKRIWLISKIYIPYLLNSYDRLIIIDSDMIFIEDPLSLWRQFDDTNRTTWAYKMPMNHRTSANAICSCVVLINVQRVLNAKLYPHEFQRALETDKSSYRNDTGLYRTERGDQAVYFLLQKLRPELFESLHQRFDIDHCHRYRDALHNTSRARVSILHYNCPRNMFVGHYTGEAFFTFYRTYKWEWLRAEQMRNHTVIIRYFEDSAQQALDKFNKSISQPTKINVSSSST